MKRKHSRHLLPLTIALSGFVVPARAVTLVGWDTPTSTTTISNTAATVVAAGVVAGDIFIGPGLTLSSSSSGWRASTYNQTGTTGTALTNANTGGDYWSFAIGAAANYNLTLTNIGSLSFAISASGPKNWGFLYSTNNFTSFSVIATGSQATNSTASYVTAFGGALASNNITITAGNTGYFRLVGYGASASGGTGGIANSTAPDFTIMGDAISLNANLSWGGGSGNWNYTSPNWSNGGSSATFSSGNDATITNGGTLTVDNAGVTAGAVAVSGSSDTTFQGGALTASSISKSGSATLTLGVVGTYASGVSIDAGQVTVATNGALNGNFTASAGTILDVGATTNTVGAFSATDADVNGSGKITATSYTLVASTNASKQVQAELSGSGNLTKSGTGTITLSGANTYTGDTIVSGGVLATSGNERVSDSSVLKPGTGSTFRLGGNETVRALETAATSASIDLQNFQLTIGAGTSAGVSNAYAGQIVGLGSVTKTGQGVQSIDNNYSFSGGMTLEEGALRVRSSGTRVTNVATSEVTLSTSAFGTGALTVKGGRIFSSSLTNSATPGRTIYVGMNIAGDFALGDNTAATGDITVSTNVTGAATALLTNATVTADAVVDWEQPISGASYGLTKSGASTMTLRGANTLSSLSVAQGSLIVRGDNSVSQVTVQNGALLGYTASTNPFGAAVVNLADGSTFGQSGTMGGGTTAERTIAASLSIQGNVSLGLGGNANYFGGNVNLNGAGRTLTLTNSSYFSGVISNGGLVVQSPNNTAKTVSLSGASTYAGGTTFAGTNVTLLVNNTTGSGTGTGTLEVSAGNTLGGSGIVGSATTIAGTHAPGNSPGVQTFTNGLTYVSGATFVWELAANTSTGRGISFDGVDVTGGTLSINTGVTNNLVFNSLGSSVIWSDAFWDTDQSWLVFSDASAPSLAVPGIFSTVSVGLDSLGGALTNTRTAATFAWTANGNDVYLNYTVPEPSTYALLAIAGAAFAGYSIRRRKRAGK